ncbi:LysR family transcriptional regulator [Acuticoccus mangrovi]|uniref:LysR family transcriptional regulator n=1 Tax=Acuticoccus mangrovi TaxID=2796142 RepID=A0A934IDJ9_9HYPH|nr:LysR family transcriptional regulator [Acuticoccus mangrovi]MBJ3774573.1 LysR family transcriptional regulator [Acuticoccus mangrovi]
MDLRDLAYFEAVAQCASYEEAAERVGRTKPALTKAVRRLEDSLGARLFHREGRGKRLTEVGEALLERARRLRRDTEAAERDVGALARGEAGVLRLGAGTTVAEHLLPEACARLKAAAPDVAIALQIGMSDVLRALLRAGECDLVIAPLSPGAPSEDPEFNAHVVFVDEMVVAAGPDHRLAGPAPDGRASPQLADLSAEEWVLPSRSVATRAWLDDLFASHGLPVPRAKVEASSLAPLPALVADTGLLTFVGRDSLGPLVALDVAEARLVRRFAMLTRRRELPPVAARFAALLMDLAPQPVPGDSFSRIEYSNRPAG